MNANDATAAVKAADDAHTAAVQEAAGTGAWGMVAAAAAAVHQARAAAAAAATEPAL